MKEQVIEAFAQLASSIAQATPKVALGLGLLVLGIVVAKVIETVLRTVLRRVHFDALVKKAGVEAAIHRLGIRQELSAFLPRCVYYLVLVLLVQTTADALGLRAISDAISSFFAYLPNLVAALLLVIVGSSLGQFAGEMVARSAADSGLDIAPALGRLVSGGVFFVCAMMAVSQLKIDTAIVRIVTSIILGGAALAFGLSFGFGTREIVRSIAAGYYARQVLEVGRTVEIDGHKGVLKAITATHLVLDAGGEEISVANGALLRSAARQS